MVVPGAYLYIYILFAIVASSLFLFEIFKLVKAKYNLAETSVVVIFTIAQGVLIQTTIYHLFGWINSGPFLRAVESVNMLILISFASIVNYQLLSNIKGKFRRITFGIIAGLGLAVVWIATAYMLFLIAT